MKYWTGNFIYYFKPLVDDPTKRRIIVEITPNPAGMYSQVLNCIHTEVVDINESSSIALDRQDGHSFWLHRPTTSAGLSWEPVYTDLPNLRQVFKDEVKHKERNEYQKLWIRKKREKHTKPVMCKECDQFFLPKRSTATFCSSRCRLRCHRANKSPAFPKSK